jgi:hypothetical protein
MNTILVPYEKYDAFKEDIAAWLKTRGKGTTRYGGKAGEVTHWLGVDDWCYYTQWDTERIVETTVFLFRKEEDAVEFALRFA